eukprot:13064124-Alexandrium_andersonii.AAC.1
MWAQTRARCMFAASAAPSPFASLASAMPAGYTRTMRPRSTPVTLLWFFGAAAAFVDSGSTRA